MVRSGDWKLLISRFPDARSIDALYHLKDDPGEVDNRLFDGMPEADGRVAEDLRQKLISWLVDVGSPFSQSVRDRQLPKVEARAQAEAQP
jgi:hypothetical protein